MRWKYKFRGALYDVYALHKVLDYAPSTLSGLSPLVRVMW